MTVSSEVLESTSFNKKACVRKINFESKYMLSGESAAKEVGERGVLEEGKEVLH